MSNGLTGGVGLKSVNEITCSKSKSGENVPEEQKRNTGADAHGAGQLSICPESSGSTGGPVSNGSSSQEEKDISDTQCLEAAMSSETLPSSQDLFSDDLVIAGPQSELIASSPESEAKGGIDSVASSSWTQSSPDTENGVGGTQFGRIQLRHQRECEKNVPSRPGVPSKGRKKAVPAMVHIHQKRMSVLLLKERNNSVLSSFPFCFFSDFGFFPQRNNKLILLI